jgi:EmrB/QacA subfamily drug resistance transporter
MSCRVRLVEPPPLGVLVRQSFHPWLVVGVTCISAFMGQLDASIVQLALPTLKQTFGVSVNAVRWVAIAYLLAFASCLPIFGCLCQMFGRKLIYLIGFALFTVASLLCGLAPDLAWLVGFRILQGVGGGMLGANSMAVLVTSVAADRRGRAIGLFTAAQAVGVSVGPVAGGLLLDALGWRSVFWATVPFGLAAAVFGWLVLPRTTDVAASRTFDWPGALLLMPSLVLIVLMLNQTSVWPLVSPEMILCTAAAIALLVLFVRQERAAAWPLVDLALFRNRGFTVGIIGVLLSYTLLYGMFFLMSFALIHGLHNSTRIAGLKLAVIPVAIGLMAPLGVGVSERFGSRVVSTIGMLLCTAALVVVAVIAFSPKGTLVSGLSNFAVFGTGLALFMAPNSQATIDAAPAGHAATAGAMVNLIRVLGSCLGVSAASSMMSWRLEQLVRPDQLDVLFGGRPLLDAVESSLFMLAVFALGAAAAALVRRPSSTPQSPT